MTARRSTPAGIRSPCSAKASPPSTRAAGGAASLAARLRTHGSGALLTAAEARSLGREVYAVPGPLDSAASSGANTLIASGLARALTGPESFGFGGRPIEPHQILDLLAAGPQTPDALRADAAQVAELLLAGRIVALPDGRLARV